VFVRGRGIQDSGCMLEVSVQCEKVLYI